MISLILTAMLGLLAPQDETPWLGINPSGAVYYGTERFMANWALYGQRWKATDGSDATVLANELPAEPATSVIMTKGVTYPSGEWHVKWRPISADVQLQGPGIVEMSRIEGMAKYRLVSGNQVLIRTSAALEALGVFPPGYSEKDLFWGWAYLPLWKTRPVCIRDLNWGNVNRAWAQTHDGWDPIWDERPLPTDYRWTWTGVPLEIRAMVANALRVKYYWHCLPHNAPKDYVQGTARIFKEILSPDITVALEYTNESWNTGFPQGIYYANHGGPAQAGIDARQAFEWWQEVFPADRTMPVIMGHQASVSFAQQMAQSAGDIVEGVGCAAYMPPWQQAVNEWKQRARIDPTDLPTVEEVNSAVRHTLEVILPGHLAIHASLAELLDVPLLIYEGGPSMYAGHAPYGVVYVQADKLQGMGDIVRDHLNFLQGFRPLVYCHFSYMGQPSHNAQYGLWGLLYDYVTPTPKWFAYEAKAKETIPK